MCQTSYLVISRKETDLCQVTDTRVNQGGLSVLSVAEESKEKVFTEIA